MEMPNSALGALVKGTKIEIFCWEVIKSGEFNFLLPPFPQ